MQIIKDAISPERLEQARKIFEQEAKLTPEEKAASLDAQLRELREAEAELADRQEFERRQKVAAR